MFMTLQPSPGFPENGTKKRNYPAGGSCVEDKWLVVADRGQNGSDWLENIERQREVK